MYLYNMAWPGLSHLHEQSSFAAQLAGSARLFLDKRAGGLLASGSHPTRNWNMRASTSWNSIPYSLTLWQSRKTLKVECACSSFSPLFRWFNVYRQTLNASTRLPSASIALNGTYCIFKGMHTWGYGPLVLLPSLPRQFAESWILCDKP